MNGNIEVRDLVMSYSPDLPPVIRDVSFRIKGGEKIAIVGRTGAGKSSVCIKNVIRRCFSNSQTNFNFDI